MLSKNASIILILLAPSLLRGETGLIMLTRFDRPPDTVAIESMQEEAAGLFSDAGLTFSWRQDVPSNGLLAGVPPVWVQFHGNCRLDPAVVPTGGPMATTSVSDGRIRPIVNVDCDRTAAVVWQIRSTLPAPLVTRAFGRALGRVLAHELYHYLTQSAIHTESELFSKAMDGRRLTAPNVRFEPGEIEALRKGVAELAAIRVRT